jgi:glutamate formiminotransferase
MATMKKIIECVPNFSEGRDSETIEKIIEPFRGEKSVKLLDYQTDEDHNRMVVTVVGEPDALKTAIIDAIGRAINVIDMRTHQGQHPRMGATDVVPFIPIKNISMEAAVEFSKDVAKAVAKKYSLPIFLYEKSASRPARQNLANIRKGQFEGMVDKIKLPEWTSVPKKFIPVPEWRPWAPECRWSLTMSTWIATTSRSPMKLRKRCGISAAACGTAKGSVLS